MVLAQVLYGWANYIDFRWQSSTPQAPGEGGVGRGLALHDLWHGESGRDDSCSIRSIEVGEEVSTLTTGKRQ